MLPLSPQECSLISVIIPIYKVEPYLDRCVQSVVDQTYKNLEIILVDDGSPDRCGAMCDEWAAKDERIKVIHKENGGLSDARNAGMAVANGELLGFVDSDDRIAPEMYQLLYENMTKQDSDLAACGVEMVWEDGSASRMLTPAGSRLLSTTAALEALLRETLLKQPVWYKLYKTNLIRDIPFPVGKYHEDVFWSWQAVSRASKISIFDTPCYFYNQRNGSIMGESYSLRRLDALEAKMLCVEGMRQKCPTLINVAKCNLWGSCMHASQMLMRHCSIETQQQGMAIIHQILQRYPIQLKDLAGESLKQRIWLTMAKVSLVLTCCIRNWMKIGF